MSYHGAGIFLSIIFLSWDRFVSQTTLDWAAEALDLLIASPCLDTEPRKSFLQAILDRAAGFVRHVTPDTLPPIVSVRVGQRTNLWSFR